MRIEQANEIGTEAEAGRGLPTGQVLKRPKIEAEASQPPTPLQVVLEPSAHLQEVGNLYDFVSYHLFSNMFDFVENLSFYEDDL